MDDSDDSESYNITLEEEVDSYLGVPPRKNVDSITFWQVCVSFPLFYVKSTYVVIRRMNTDFLHYSSLLWMFFPFRLLQFLVKGFSPLVKRQLQTGGTIWAQG
jgi:hypothetical protein